MKRVSYARTLVRVPYVTRTFAPSLEHYSKVQIGYILETYIGEFQRRKRDLSVGGYRCASSTKEKELDPIWKEVLVLPLPRGPSEIQPPFASAHPFEYQS